MDTPFSRSARAYFDSGWSPIPLPHEAKGPVPDHPTSFTGAKGAYVDGAQLRRWLGERARAQAGKLNYPPGNIAIRLPKDIIGIDVDAYGEKAGAATLDAAEAEWGALPATWVSTSRTDGRSGIRLYRIPEGLSWPGELPQGKGVELIRWDHRYMIVSPSIHDKTKEEYRWCRETIHAVKVEGDSEEIWEVALVDSPDEFPDADAVEIPALPVEWVEGLTGGKKWEERATAELGDDEAREWIAARPGGEPCSHMSKLLTKAKTAIQRASDDGGVHEAALESAWGMLNDAKAGHAGVSKALSELAKVFATMVRPRRESDRQVKAEWGRIVVQGVSKVSADGSEESFEDSCDAPTTKGSLPDGSPGRLGSDDIVYEYTDVGNAARLLRVANNRARWVPAWKEWVIWDGQKWSADPDGQMDRWAVKAVNEMDDELRLMEGSVDPDVLKAHRAWKKRSADDSKISSMQRVLRSRKGISLPADRFDADPTILVAPNGTIELRDSPPYVRFRESRREDYNTFVTGAPYEPTATHELWDSYLDLFMPDKEVRDWLQRLVGYSLFGANDEQLLVIGLGGTSRGKTTFTEGILAALGGYAGPLEATVLRSNGDDKPRPDILKSMSRRIVIAEELSEFQHLHVDQVKRITGAGTVSARGMNSNKYVERLTAFTPWLMTNEVPTITGADAALRNRVLTVPFDVFKPRDKASAAIRRRTVALARPAILAWAIEGWSQYSEGEDLRSVPAGALAANARFNAEVSEFHQFIAQCCEMGDGLVAWPEALFSAYQIWASDNGIPERDQLTRNAFGRRLSGIGTDRRREFEDGKQQWKRYGIRLLSGVPKA